MGLFKLIYFNTFSSLVVFLAINFTVVSQTRVLEIDSLKYLLQQTENDTLTIAYHYAIYEALKSTSPDTAKVYLNKGLNISQQGDYQELRLKGLELLAFYWLNRGIGDSTLSISKEARETSNLSKKQEATFLLLEGRALDAKGQYSEAVDKLFESLVLSEALNDGPAIADTYGNIGNVFWRLENLDKAQEYYNKGVEVAKQHRLRLKNAHLLANLGMVAKENGEFERALEAYQESLTINKSLGNKLDEAIDLMNIGVLYMDNDELAIARKYLEDSNELSKEVNDKVMITLSTINLAIVEEKSGNHSSELALLDKAKKLAVDLHYKPALKEIYNSYAFAYTQLGNYKAALENQKLYEAWKDSIYNERYTNKISELEIKYETEKKQNEILRLSEENLKQEAVITKSDSRLKNLLFVGLISAALFVGAFLVYRQKSELNKQKAIFEAMAKTEINEQQRIARDLHDSIGAMVVAAKNQLTDIEVDNREHKLKLEKSRQLLAQTAEETRRISHNMMPEELTRFGLVNALEDFLQTAVKGDFKTEFVHFGMDERLAPVKELHIFRIVQELFQNIQKHAKAKHGTLQLTKHEKELNLVVEDDGIGFVNHKMARQGLGLQNVLSRIDFLKGTLHIDTQLEKGTTININIPLV